tara:strand:- start:1596 stop:2156 length:561 start_codon:yes stop_codon:yes gene_type:complete
MDLNRFLQNVGATKKVINKNTDHVMLSTLSTLDQSFDEGDEVLSNLQFAENQYQDTIQYVESTIIARNKQDFKVQEAFDKVEDLQRTHDAEMQDQKAKQEDAEIELDEIQDEYGTARSDYDDKEHDLSYWEGQAMQLVNRLNNQIAALVSGAENLGIEVNVDKYVNLRNRLEDNVNHDKINWTQMD